jgi:hypothetical protein
LIRPQPAALSQARVAEIQERCRIQVSALDEEEEEEEEEG